ncbi:DUF1761 domain-containing protein [Pontibacter sp. SGAir0037]|uniref:DUF1761 domain-containing protein n=1 Tax=Pontibacter sp. SGAir0037 TaxID=2571030 RepID=UPI0010CCBB82|nr:DUF1761 domain-containing protein [Pontibacter sp. SGAir0037]QCR24477.1 DUF1761 domain-containing protein [Pontibacter sp. SGAir0037]
MEVSDIIQSLNWFNVTVAAVATYLIGNIWYSFFGKDWVASVNHIKVDLRGRSMPRVVGVSYLSFFMSLNLALFIGRGGMLFGLLAGLMGGIGWLVSAICTISLLEKQPWKYLLKRGIYIVLIFAVMGLLFAI